MKKELVRLTSTTSIQPCFNPCSNGMKKETVTLTPTVALTGFNPCSNGMKKEHRGEGPFADCEFVLILVLME